MMFTIDQIKAAHSKVKSGADFPAYIQELRQLGIIRYESFVADGRVVYEGSKEDDQVIAPAKYDTLIIAPIVDPLAFRADLLAHQQGKTDYPTFCNDCAKSGIVKWIVQLDEKTCTYFDLSGNEVLAEAIPG